MMQDGWMNWGQGGLGVMWFDPLLMAEVLFLAVTAMFALFRANREMPIAIRTSTRTRSQMLDERFAQAEINQEEF